MKNIETEHLEFKASLSQINRACESLSAMLNKHSKGRVIFGIDDDGIPVGLTLGNKTIKDISHEIAEKIKPNVIPSIEVDEIEGKQVIIVTVEGINKPYSANGNYYIRSGSENKKIEPALLRELVFKNSDENMIEIESFNQELRFEQLKQKYILRGMSVNQNFEKSMVLVNREGKYNLLGNILSDNNDVSIKVVRFAGYDKTEMIVRNEYGYKCLLYALDEVIEYVRSLNETRVYIDGNSTRKEVQLFDEECFREAWNNACLHTNWVKQIPPAVYIYNDRMEIISTGGLPLDFTEQQFFEGISHPINRHLQKIMGQLGYVEQTGHGVLTIIRKYGRNAFKITDNNVIVTLKFPFEISSKNLKFTGLNDSEKRVLTAINNKPSITKAELSKVVNLTISSISNIIKNLKQLNYIERIGSNKIGYWKIKK